MSDQEPRVRELAQRLMNMAPDAPPFPQEAVMNPRTSQQRRPVLVWAAAAIAVVLLVGVPLFLFRGGDEPADPATTIAAPTSTGPTTTVVGEPTTIPDTTGAGSVATSSPPTVLLPATTSGDCRQDWEGIEARDVDTWYVFLACDRPGMEDVLVPRARALRVDLGQDLGLAIGAQLWGPTEDELAAGYSAFTVDKPRAIDDDSGVIDGYTTSGGRSGLEVRFIDFRFDPGMTNASASAASSQLLAQLSSAVFQFPSFSNLALKFGDDCDEFWNWLQRDCTVLTRSDWETGEITAEIAAWGETAFEVPSTTVPPEDVSTTSLPGGAFDIGPGEGDVVAVIGVRYDDVLWLRDGPGVGYEPMLGLDPLEDGVVATGRHRLLESSIWNEVTVDGVTGWANSRFLGYLGSVDDITAGVRTAVGEDVIEAETMIDLAAIIIASFEPEESGFRWEISVAPAVGDLGEITVDVLGFADDSQLGLRMHIFGQSTTGGEGFELKSVEATSICGRGVTAAGLCV